MHALACLQDEAWAEDRMWLLSRLLRNELQLAESLKHVSIKTTRRLLDKYTAEMHALYASVMQVSEVRLWYACSASDGAKAAVTNA